ncbi:AAA family ATPase [Vibrio caribbeanicus]|uniref:AAA family ATPase n=1 Tax=Vibrio caribbeanicus TaxID=701175 RepID=UPI002284266C|nr:AAA family ATPase [Vibrio caribbeanicus]MCY9846063.1 AAA family ATPase [Vibrio caribbeanicus]
MQYTTNRDILSLDRNRKNSKDVLPQKRRVIGYPVKEFEEQDRGLFQVMFEVFDNGQIALVNDLADFCNTEQVFIYHNYSSLTDKGLVELECNLIRDIDAEEEDGRCRYSASGSDKITLPKAKIVQVIHQDELPDWLDAKIGSKLAPLTQLIVLQVDENIIGPFEWSKASNAGEFKIAPVSSPLPQKSRSDGYVHKLDKHTLLTNLISYQKSTDNLKFLNSLNTLMSKRSERLDYLPIGSLINQYGRPLLESQGIKGQSKNLLKQIANNAPKSKEATKHPERFERLSQLINQTIEWPEIRDGVINSFLSTEQGVEEIQAYIIENEKSYFEKYRQEAMLAVATEIDTIESKKKELQISLEEIRQEVRKATNERQQQEAEEALANHNEKTEAQVKKAQVDIAALTEEQQIKKDKLGSQIREREQRLSELVELDNLVDEISFQKRMQKDIERQVQILKKRRAELSEDVSDKHDQLMRQMLDIKPTVDVLFGQVPTEPSVIKQFESRSVRRLDDLDGTNLVEKRDNYVEEVRSSLALCDRDLERCDVANLLITIAQTPFVLFAGVPGVGKTSLVKRLGYCLGLGNRMHTVPVAKGWTSQRDLLGYYNSLSQSYVTAPTGVYDLLDQVENENPSEHSIVIQLWDEINLSKCEHYASPFLEMADKESSRILSTGSPTKPHIQVPDHVRIIGTMNSDDSVEPMTPRLLDRSAVLLFEEPTSDSWSLSDERFPETLKDLSPLCAAEWLRLFNSAPQLTPQEKNILESLSKVLADKEPSLGESRVISHRKRVAVARYCAMANPMMADEGPLVALDYAISQHIMPQLSGYGEGFGRRLEKVLEVLPTLQMQRSRSLVERQLARGREEMHHYRPLGVA